MAPTSATIESIQRVKLIMGWSKDEPIPFFNFVSSMKLFYFGIIGVPTTMNLKPICLTWLKNMNPTWLR